MAEETTETVKKTSDGMVKVTLEVYNELLKKAAEKAPVIVHRTVNKTPQMVRDENKAIGVGLIVVGGSMIAVGILRLVAKVHD